MFFLSFLSVKSACSRSAHALSSGYSFRSRKKHLLARRDRISSFRCRKSQKSFSDVIIACNQQGDDSHDHPDCADRRCDGPLPVEGLSSFGLSAYYRPICVIDTSATFPPSSYAPRSKGTILKTIYNVLKAVMIMLLK